MAKYNQNLLPDEMQNIPAGVDVSPWIGPNDNIVTIGTPDGPRYIRDNMVVIENPDWYPNENYRARQSFADLGPNYTGQSPAKIIRADPNLPNSSDSYNPDTVPFEETQALGRMMPPGPPPPPVAYATNVPETASRWAKEGKINQDNFSFLTNTPEETKQSREKGFGKWGKIIGPPESAIPPTKPKTEMPFPGPPPDEEKIGDFQKFNGLWNHHVQKFYGGTDPLALNPVQAREEATKAIKDQNAQFLYDYETYGPEQMGPDSTRRYVILQKQIKEAGDLAEEKIKSDQARAHQEKTQAYNFYEKFKKEQAEQGKMSKEDQQELISLRQEKTSLRRDMKDITLTEQDRKDAKGQLDRLQARENQILKKESLQQGGGRDISKGLTYMQGITDKNEIMKRANILRTQYGWSKDELNELGKKLGF